MKAPLNALKLRDCDPMGCGHYGASRARGRKHKGLDLIADPEALVFAPIDGRVKRFSRPYATDPRYGGLEIEGSVYRIKLFYVQPMDYLRIGNELSAGQSIGFVQDIAAKHGRGMLNHLHLEVYKHGLLTDPEPLLLGFTSNLVEHQKTTA